MENLLGDRNFFMDLTGDRSRSNFFTLVSVHREVSSAGYRWGRGLGKAFLEPWFNVFLCDLYFLGEED